MTMQETIMNQELANLDYSKVAALQQKRTLAFVNHFVTTTVQFLNNFMKKCEGKLMRFERKLEKVEAAMVLLEARLSSIPEVNILPRETKEVVKETATELPKQDPPEPSPNIEQEHKEITQDVEESPAQSESHPEYNRFIKMVQVGVPLQAVKLKVSLEGLDPSVLEKILGK